MCGTNATIQSGWLSHASDSTSPLVSYKYMTTDHTRDLKKSITKVHIVNIDLLEIQDPFFNRIFQVDLRNGQLLDTPQ